MSISIWDYEKPLDAMMLKHDHIAALVMRHEKEIQELKQLVTPMMEFKQPTKICGPNLEEVLNAAGFYRKKEWIGLTNEQRKTALFTNGSFGSGALWAENQIKGNEK